LGQGKEKESTSPARSCSRDPVPFVAESSAQRKEMKWFYEIRGTGNRLVKRDGQYNTEQEAISAGNAYLKNNRVSVQRKEDPNEVFTIMAGRE
jgi:hypothetical protein